MKQLTTPQAIAFAESKLYESWTERQIVEFQLFQDKLCMDFNRFHEAIEKVLQRPVFTHEFAFPDNLKKELLGEAPAPTFEQIIWLIPKEKLILIGL